MHLQNRAEAGRKLAQKLSAYENRDDVIVLALPRGGVPVAFEIARELRAPLDVFLVRKLGLPGNEEFAIGAIASGDICILNAEALHGFFIDQQTIEEIALRERAELHRREQVYRQDRAPLNLDGKTVILVDDGLATGSTMRAALAALKSFYPAQVIVALPTAPDTVRDDLSDADDVLCLSSPRPFLSVSQAYAEFPQTSDDEVLSLLYRAEALAETEGMP